MRAPRGRWRLLSLPLALLALPAPIAPASSLDPPGLTVAEVEPGREAARAGLRPGARIRAWRRSAPEPASGALRDLADWYRLIRDQAPRGEIELEIEGRARPARLGPRRWGLEVRPGAPPGLAQACEAAGEPRALLFPALCAADRALANDAPEVALGLIDLELERVADGANRLATLPLLEKKIEALDRLDRCPEALEASRSGQRIVTAALGEGPWLARFVELEADALFACERTEQAAPRAERAVAILSRIAPESLARARAQNLLGSITLELGDLPGSLAAFDSALELGLRLDATADDLVATWNGIGLNSRRLGLFARAQRAHQRSIELLTASGVKGTDLAISLLNLGTIAHDRGDLDGAIAASRSAVSEADRDGPTSLIAIVARANLVELFLARGDLASAGEIARQADLAVTELPAGSFVVGVAADAQAKLARARGDFSRARHWLLRELETFEILGRKSLRARTLESLGEVEHQRGDLGSARRFLERARDLRAEMTPDGLPLAADLHRLGALALDDRRPEEGERDLRRALEIREAVAPGSWQVAETLAALARRDRARGDLLAASGRLQRATEVLEERTEQQLSDYEARARFRSGSVAIYRELAQVLLDRGRAEEAFQVLERSRARALLAQLAERDLAPVRDAPPEIERQRRAASAAYARLWSQLEEVSPSADPARASRLATELAVLRHRLSGIGEALRERAAGSRPTTDPAPLGAEAGARLLAPRELALVFSAGESRTDLLVLHPDGGLKAVVLPLGVAALESRVAILRGLLERGRFGPEATLALRSAGGKLCSQLLGPVRAELESADSLVLVADGPLLLLPWAALTCESIGGPRFLVESHRLRTVSSLTLLGALRAMPPSAATGLLALADPVSPAAVRGARPVPLPASRLEAGTAVRLHRGGGRLLAGAEASESALKEVGAGFAALHFAAHGILDRRFPLDSALLLSPGNGEDGRLRAWEVFDQLRLDADLVVLSGCSTALGEELEGEGLLGLVRAFEHAGSRSVLASLWTVGDESTAALMERFYVRLAAGQSRSEALRGAQLELLAGPVEAPSDPALIDLIVAPLRRLFGWQRRLDATHPYRWSAFQLDGIDR